MAFVIADLAMGIMLVIVMMAINRQTLGALHAEQAQIFRVGAY